MSSDHGRRLRFYFDYISHNAYLAWTQLGGLAMRHGAVVEWKPVLFAGLLNAHGQLGPAEIPAKGRWMIRDVLRKAALLGVPLLPPASHPFNPLLALRASSLALAPDEGQRLITGLFQATWARSLDVSDPEVVAAVATEAGLPGEEIIERAGRADTKQRLRDATEEAVEEGVFGVPSMIVDGELFWGLDDFPHLERHLRGEDPLSAAELAKWVGVQPSSRRKRPPAGA